MRSEYIIGRITNDSLEARILLRTVLFKCTLLTLCTTATNKDIKQIFKAAAAGPISGGNRCQVKSYTVRKDETCIQKCTVASNSSEILLKTKLLV